MITFIPPHNFALHHFASSSLMTNIIGLSQRGCWRRLTSWCSGLSHVRLFCDLMYYSPPGPPSMGFSRQESWSGLPFPPPGDLPDPGIEPCLSCLLHWQDRHLGSPQKWVTSKESQRSVEGADTTKKDRTSLKQMCDREVALSGHESVTSRC